MVQQHPWSRFVALGDSFTEGIGDPEPRSSGGNRGWADRVAEVLATQTDDFAYANLAIRGRLLDQIIATPVESALQPRPDLITISAGGNDIIRPNTDPDRIAERLEGAIEILRSDGATVVVVTGPDMGSTPVLGRSRAKVAIFNENLRAVAARHDALVANMWALSELKDKRMWAPDRLHFSPVGHTAVARMVLRALSVESELQPYDPDPLPTRPWRQARVDDMGWARDCLLTWVVRRILHQSSGDGIAPKRPDAATIASFDAIV